MYNCDLCQEEFRLYFDFHEHRYLLHIINEVVPSNILVLLDDITPVTESLIQKWKNGPVKDHHEKKQLVSHVETQLGKFLIA